MKTGKELIERFRFVLGFISGAVFMSVVSLLMVVEKFSGIRHKLLVFGVVFIMFFIIANLIFENLLKGEEDEKN